MVDNEKHNAKKLFQNIDLEVPSANFTEKIMTKVNSMKDEEVIKDVIMTKLLKKNIYETPSSDFSNRIMEKVNANNISVFSPIISKKSWNVIFLFFISSIVYILISQPNETHSNSYISKFLAFFDKFNYDLSSSVAQNIQIPTLLIISILCLSILLWLDAVIRTKRIL